MTESDGGRGERGGLDGGTGGGLGGGAGGDKEYGESSLIEFRI